MSNLLKLMQCSVLALGLLLSISAHSASTAAQTEIDYLLDTLRQSDCRFNRNGSWYDGPAAADHLQRKARYYLKKAQSPTAEDFIKQAASVSSSSGQAYAVHCPKQTQTSSAQWFAAELKVFRAR